MLVVAIDEVEYMYHEGSILKVCFKSGNITPVKVSRKNLYGTLKRITENDKFVVFEEEKEEKEQ